MGTATIRRRAQLAQVAIRDPRFAPLAEAGAGTPSSIPQVIDGAVMPEPYRDLLVNQRDMTPNLIAYHGCPLHIVVLDSIHRHPDYRRQVMLLDSGDRPVEYGAIRIHLDRLPTPAQDEILHGCKPFGGILAHYRVPHSSRPSAFFRVETDRVLARLFAILPAEQPTLYGRCNTISLPDGRALAEVVEILPPATLFPHLPSPTPNQPEHQP